MTQLHFSFPDYLTEKIPTLRWGVEVSLCFSLNEKWLFMAMNKGLNRAC